MHAPSWCSIATHGMRLPQFLVRAPCFGFDASKSMHAHLQGRCWSLPSLACTIASIPSALASRRCVLGGRAMGFQRCRSDGRSRRCICRTRTLECRQWDVARKAFHEWATTGRTDLILGGAVAQATALLVRLLRHFACGLIATSGSRTFGRHIASNLVLSLRLPLFLLHLAFAGR